jgi:putative heme transporter
MMSQTVPVVHGATRGGSAGRRVAGAVLAFAVIAVVFVELLPRIADSCDVWSVVTTLGPAEVAALAIATAINLATFAPPWMAAIPGLGYWNATVLTQVSTALSIAVPGGDAAGIAASYAMLRRWGIGRRAVAVAVVVTGVGNQLVNVLLPLLALVLLVMTGGSSPVLLTAGLIGIAAILAVSAAFALVLRGERQALAVGRRAEWLVNHLLALVHRPPREGWGEGLVHFRRETVGFGAHNAEAVAAVLLYRALTVLPTLALGAMPGLTWPSRSVRLESGELP